MAPGEISACGGERAGHGGSAVGLGWGGKDWKAGGRQGLWARDAHPVGTVLRSGGWDTFMQADPGRGLRCGCLQHDEGYNLNYLPISYSISIR
jgi:hypothetical protein